MIYDNSPLDISCHLRVAGNHIYQLNMSYRALCP
jgi:hypothetical protein